MRVVAGEFRGRRLIAPAGDTTRPTTDRVREAVFNSLVSMDLLIGNHVIDAFAGSGALGIEALSRGADRCTFIERDRRALDALTANLRALDLAGRATVIGADAVGSLARVEAAAVVLADPPYSFDDWSSLLAVAPAPFVVAESANRVEPVPGWVVSRQKRYGRTWVTFLGANGGSTDRSAVPVTVPDAHPTGEIR